MDKSKCVFQAHLARRSLARCREAQPRARSARRSSEACQASKTAFRSRYARPDGTLREAFCPNIQPRAHARLTGLTTAKLLTPIYLNLKMGRNARQGTSDGACLTRPIFNFYVAAPRASRAGLPHCGSGPWPNNVLLSLHNPVACAARALARRPSEFWAARAHRYTGLATTSGKPGQVSVCARFGLRFQQDQDASLTYAM